jgi:hypothetical protein
MEENKWVGLMAAVEAARGNQAAFAAAIEAVRLEYENTNKMIGDGSAYRANCAMLNARMYMAAASR